MAVPCILDCDPGHDDAIAILLAAAHPGIDLRAITTVAGNGPLDKVTFNARRVCTLAGLLDVPIAAGAAGPAEGELEAATDVHGESALDGPELPDPEVELDPRPASELIGDMLRDAEEPLTILATGPLTNVARVVSRSDLSHCGRWCGWGAPRSAGTGRRMRSSTPGSIHRRWRRCWPPASRSRWWG